MRTRRSWRNQEKLWQDLGGVKVENKTPKLQPPRIDVFVPEPLEAGDAIDDQAMSLAIGRLFMLLSRPYQSGDIEQYEMCRRVAMEAGERLGYRGLRPQF